MTTEPTTSTIPTAPPATSVALAAFLDEQKAHGGDDRLALQTGQPGEGLGYNPAKPLPYPIFVAHDYRCENVPGYPLRHGVANRDELPILAGFQHDATVQNVDLMAEDWDEDWQQAVGMIPVFFEPAEIGDGMFSLTVPITSVQLT